MRLSFFGVGVGTSPVLRNFAAVCMRAGRMFMIGTVVNTLAIAAGAAVGHYARRAMGAKLQHTLYTAMGLCALALGVNAVCRSLPRSEYPVLFVVSLAAGGAIGSRLGLEERFHRLVGRGGDGSLATGLATGILLYCVGTLSILGPMMSALYGDETYLLTNATLDFVTSACLASTYGLGMALAAPVLFAWQGAIYLAVRVAGEAIPETLVTELTAVGGVLIVAGGLSILKVRDCRTLDLLPALAVTALYVLAARFFGG